MALRDRLSPGQVLVMGEGTERYETDVLGRRGRASWVALPRDTEDVREVLKWAYSYRAPFVVQGANTGPVGACVPDTRGIQGVLNMERCRGTFSIDPIDRTVTVSAGIDLASLNDTLADHGLMLPIDLGANPTVGGMVGANTGGARLIRHGDVRRHVLGLEVVLPDEGATVLPLMRGLRKDNRGPDLKHLFVGSSGLLGVVTAAVLAVDPLPRQTAVALLQPATEGDIFALLARLEHRASDHLSAFELLSRPTLEAISRHRSADLRWPFRSAELPELVVLVELSTGDAGSASRPISEELAEIVAESAESGEITDSWFGPASQLWSLRHFAIDALRAEGPMIAFDLSTSRTSLLHLRRSLFDLVARLAPDARPADFGHVADGGLHLIVTWPETAGRESRTGEKETLSAAVYDLVEESGGTFSAEHGVGRDNETSWRKHTPPELWRLLATVKTMCDPLGLLGALDLSDGPPPKDDAMEPKNDSSAS